MDAPGSPPPAPHDAGELDALNVPGSAPPRPPCAEEGGIPRTRRDHHSRPQPRKDGTRPDQHTATPAVAEGEGGRCAGSSPAPARRSGRDAPDLPDHHHQHPHAAMEADALDVPDHHHQHHHAVIIILYIKMLLHFVYLPS